MSVLTQVGPVAAAVKASLRPPHHLDSSSTGESWPLERPHDAIFGRKLTRSYTLAASSPAQHSRLTFTSHACSAVKCSNGETAVGPATAADEAFFEPLPS